jgi:hypothetical protein
MVTLFMYMLPMRMTGTEMREPMPMPMLLATTIPSDATVRCASGTQSAMYLRQMVLAEAAPIRKRPVR